MIGLAIRKLIAAATTLSLLLACPVVSAQEPDDSPIIMPEDSPASYLVEGPPKPPRWSLEIKGGDFEPDLDEWQTFFGEETSNEIGIAFAFKLKRWLEVGAAVDYIRDKGTGQLPLNDDVGGNVTYNLFPAHVYVLLRGIFHENQRIVPYVGGGFTRAYYRQKIDNQSSRRGETDGEHTRAGLQILLDWIDQDGASGLQSETGINNTYLILEVKKFSADVEGIELGGESAMVGLLFEF